MIGIHEEFLSLVDIDRDKDAKEWVLMGMVCSECGRNILRIDRTERGTQERLETLVHPRGSARAPLGDDVPKKYGDDYREACLVIVDSPKASAALSRRCLQLMLRDEGGAKHGNLSNEIDEMMPKLPSYLGDAIDGVRNIGNFAAHATKSENTGAIVEVEPAEAEWLLETLEGLFDFYFVQPELLSRKRNELNKKLQETGKPDMKQNDDGTQS